MARAETGRCREITIDRPRALNALNVEMVRALAEQLSAALADESVACISLAGAGDRAFCAGGDVRAVSESMDRRADGPGDAADTFFDEEYELDLAVAEASKPVVPFLHGVAMGGGLGLSLHRNVVVAEPDARLAMPETGLGFFPDVGGAAFLSKAGALGTYLALTGRELSGVEAAELGWVSHVIERSRWQEARECLGRLDPGADDEAASSVLDPLVTTTPLPSSSFLKDRRRIEEWFAPAVDVRTTFKRLAKAAHPRADEALAILGRRCPMSLCVTLEHLHRSKDRTLKETLDADRRLAAALVRREDFHEGIRATLIDKDKRPIWAPRTLVEINKRDVTELMSEDA